jgi:hypothetical protein
LSGPGLLASLVGLVDRRPKESCLPRTWGAYARLYGCNVVSNGIAPAMPGIFFLGSFFTFYYYQSLDNKVIQAVQGHRHFAEEHSCDVVIIPCDTSRNVVSNTNDRC